MNQTRIEMKKSLLFTPLFIIFFLYACNNGNTRDSLIKHQELLKLYEDSAPLKVKAKAQKAYDKAVVKAEKMIAKTLKAKK